MHDTHTVTHTDCDRTRSINMELIFQCGNSPVHLSVDLFSPSTNQHNSLWLRCVCFFSAVSSQCSSLNPVFCIVCCWFLNFLDFFFLCTNNIVCSCGQRLKFLRISGYAHISLKSWVNEMWQLNGATKKERNVLFFVKSRHRTLAHFDAAKIKLATFFFAFIRNSFVVAESHSPAKELCQPHKRKHRYEHFKKRERDKDSRVANVRVQIKEMPENKRTNLSELIRPRWSIYMCSFFL